MITIAIDESGSFEKNDKELKFVGGLIYTKEDYEEEKTRIENMLKNCCLELSEYVKDTYKVNMELKYPENIHTTDLKINSSRIKEDVKRKLREKVESYIKANGNYYYTCLLYTNHKLLRDFNEEVAVSADVSNIIDPRGGSNLYETMVSRLIFNNILYNPKLEHGDDVKLHIATRTVNIKKSDTNYLHYKNLGYNTNEVNDEDVRVYLTDQRTFKSLIATKILEADFSHKKINFSLNVQSISYKTGGLTSPFLYLADIVCNSIRESFKCCENYELNECARVIKNTTGNEFMCWVYDDIDLQWNNLVMCYERKDLIKALDIIYNIKEKKLDYKEFYLKNWVKFLENNLEEIFDENKLDVYNSEIDSLLSKDVQDYSKALFIGEKLWGIVNAKENIDKKSMYRLCDVLLRGYNHQGSLEGEKYFNKCYELKRYVTVDEYLSTVNRAVEVYANAFNFQKGIEMLQYSKECLFYLKETLKEISLLNEIDGQESYSLPSMGKVLSSLGQFFAFSGNNEEATKYFLEAMKEFNSDSKDETVTLSYMLHHFIDQLDKSQYERYAKKYFGEIELLLQYDRILQERNNFKLFVFIKALNEFYYSDLKDEQLNRILTMNYDALGFWTKDHPWELIYKHLALIELKRNNIKIAEKILERATSINRGITINLINQNSILEFLICKKEVIEKQLSKGYIKELETIVKEFNRVFRGLIRIIEEDKFLKESFKNILEIKDDTNIQHIAKTLREKFRYMYS